MDPLDRLAIPIPEYPIAESTLRDIKQYILGEELYHRETEMENFERSAACDRITLERLTDSFPEGHPYRIALEKMATDERHKVGLEEIMAGQKYEEMQWAKFRDAAIERMESAAKEIFIASWEGMAEDVHALAVEKGWWENDRNDGEIIALIHSELSEALEALRSGNPPSEKIQNFSWLEEELSDAVIRIMDYAAVRKLRVGEAIVAKHAFNTTRPYKHGKKF